MSLVEGLHRYINHVAGGCTAIMWRAVVLQCHCSDGITVIQEDLGFCCCAEVGRERHGAAREMGRCVSTHWMEMTPHFKSGVDRPGVDGAGS